MYYTIASERHGSETKIFAGATKEEAAIPEALWLLEQTEEILKERSNLLEQTEEILKERSNEEDFFYLSRYEKGKFALSQGDFLKAAGELWGAVEGYFYNYDVRSFDDSDLIVMSREEASARLLAKDIV